MKLLMYTHTAYTAVQQGEGLEECRTIFRQVLCFCALCKPPAPVFSRPIYLVCMCGSVCEGGCPLLQ